MEEKMRKIKKPKIRSYQWFFLWYVRK
jgi:hypothetical protein